MRIIEHRRHTMRSKPGKHLTQAGVDLARRVGADLGAFDLVIASKTPRAIETAIAMGYATDERIEELATTPKGFEDEVGADADFARFAEVVQERRDGAVARYAREMEKLHAGIAGRLQDGGRALIISHGWVIESSAVGCLPSTEFADWGPPCSFCEGIRLYIDGDRFVRGEPLRVTLPG